MKSGKTILFVALLGLLENDFELSAFAFDVKSMLIAENKQALLEIFESGVRFALKVFFIEHGFRVPEESEKWVVGSGQWAVGEEPKLRGKDVGR